MALQGPKCPTGHAGQFLRSGDVPLVKFVGSVYGMQVQFGVLLRCATQFLCPSALYGKSRYVYAILGLPMLYRPKLGSFYAPQVKLLVCLRYAAQ